MKTFRELLNEKVDILPKEAKEILNNLSSDNFHILSSSEVDELVDLAKKNKYRKSKNAPGSTARMFFQYLEKLSKRS